MPSATTPAHIPAWKRLGLKLKSAKEESGINSDSPTTVDTLKRKRVEKEDTSRKSKKTFTTTSDSPVPITPNSTRKKSVTFTPETKVDDGDSIKQLFNSWVTEQKSQDPSFELKNSNPVFQTPTPANVEEQVDLALDQKEQRVKRVKKPKPEPGNLTPKSKKPKATKKPKASEAPAPTNRPFLQYLKAYHESRNTWKFNKNHQTHLLKHIFNVDVIPSDHIHLVYPYVRGLQGTVRTRLRDEALSIKVNDIEAGIAGFPEDMADRSKAQKDYEAAMAEYIAHKTATDPRVSSAMGYEQGVLLGLSDFAMKHRVAKRLRAEEVITELASSSDSSQTMDNDTDGENLKRLRLNSGQSQKVARKRKQRTAMEEDSNSSESSSDSDSSSEDSSGSDNDSGTDSSSSSSSSSSSGDDTDSGSAEEDDSDEDAADDSSSSSSSGDSDSD